MNNKISAWIKLRKQPQVLNSIKQPVIWLHASSGEIEFVKSYIRDLKKMKPEYSIVVSYSSPSAQKLFDNIKPYVDQFFPLPWDQPQAIRKVLAHYNPTAIYFARTDLWPEFLYQLKVSRVKSYIVSYNPHLGFFNKLWIKLFLKNFTGLFCLNEIQEAALKEILPTGVKILAAGDTRYDQVFWRLQQPSKIPFQIPEPYFVFGSTWKEDEDIFVPLFAEFKKLGIKIVWCPHEIDNSNMDRIEKVLSTEKIDYQKFSMLTTADTDLILLDKVGYLADFYRLADGAFVGGSFKAKVHSVMEPLCCAIPIITGPYIYNSPEAMQYHQIIMNDLRVVQIVNNSTEMLGAIKKICSLHKTDFKKLLIGNLQKNRYATRKIMESMPD